MCRWYIDFALYLNRVKLLVLWVGVFFLLRMKTGLTLSFISHLLEWEAVYLLIKTDCSNGNHIRGLFEGRGGTVLHVRTTKTASSLSAAWNTVCRQPALGRSQPGDCPVWLCWVPAVGLQPPTSKHPSQLDSSLERWRPGSTQPAASTRGHCDIEEEEEEEEEGEREEFRKHWSLEDLSPGMRTSVCKPLGKCVWSTTISVETPKRKGMATGSCRGSFVSTSDVTRGNWKVTPRSKPFPLHHVNLEEQRIPYSWGDIWGQGGGMSYARALQRGSSACYNNNEVIFTNICMKFAVSRLDQIKGLCA